MLSQLITKACTLKRATTGSSDSYGNETPTFTDVTTVCELQQQRRDEPDAQGEMSATVWRAFFLPAENMGSDPTANRLTVDGTTYEFVGAPWLARNPRTQVDSHWEANVKVAG